MKSFLGTALVNLQPFIYIFFYCPKLAWQQGWHGMTCFCLFLSVSTEAAQGFFLFFPLLPHLCSADDRPTDLFIYLLVFISLCLLSGFLLSVDHFCLLSLLSKLLPILLSFISLSRLFLSLFLSSDSNPFCLSLTLVCLFHLSPNVSVDAFISLCLYFLLYVTLSSFLFYLIITYILSLSPSLTYTQIHTHAHLH